MTEETMQQERTLVASPSTTAGACRPIRLVTFDLYDTLIELVPPRWERFAAAARGAGLAVDEARILAADTIAEDFFTIENGAVPVRDRPLAEREAFRVRYTARWLAAAGLPADPAIAKAVRERYVAELDPAGLTYRVFPDVMPALARLKAAGIKRAVISNADADVTALCTRLAFASEMDVIVTSALIGYEKPDRRTFEAALAATRTEPADTLHIGDQPKSDISGALAIGMRAALIDRYGRHPVDEPPVPHFTSLITFADDVVKTARYGR